MFETTFPSGANGTSLVLAGAGARDSYNQVITQFPSLVDAALEGTLSWAGSFVGAQQNRNVTGPTGGPTVFYDPSDASLADVVVLSALNNFKATSAGPGTVWDASKAAFAPGISGTITSLPAGFSQQFVLRAGSKGGITATIGEWGQLLQTFHSTYRTTDITLTNIGYQTDNGAGYVFCRPQPPYHNCSQLLIDELKQLKAQGVPMGYLSFQGAGSSTMLDPLSLGLVHEGSEQSLQGAQASAAATPREASWGRLARHDAAGSAGPVQSAPWCVNEWGPDLNMTQRGHGTFPMDEGAFQKELGVPLQLYAP